MSFAVYDAVLTGADFSIIIINGYPFYPFDFINVDHTAIAVAAPVSLFGYGITIAAVVVKIIDGQLYGAAVACVLHDVVV